MQMFEEKDVKRQVRNCNYSMDETNLSSNEELHIQAHLFWVASRKNLKSPVWQLLELKKTPLTEAEAQT